jgi:putative RNA 2'-phosphotransferase
MNRQVELSKFIALILRHKPSVIGLTLDDHGWANVDDLIKGIRSSGKNISFDVLKEIVANDNKQRYSFNEDCTKIRANQGHSINVDVELHEAIPPDVLYHGTSERSLSSIRSEGIKSMNRLYVHLSSDEETAVKVGKRHGKPFVLLIDTKKMKEDNIVFYKSENNVWLTKYIDPKYIKN